MDGTVKGSELIKDWLEESREAAQLVIDTYGEPHEATGSLLTWHRVDPWKRVLSDQDLEQATKEGEQKDQATPDPQTLKG